MTFNPIKWGKIRLNSYLIQFNDYQGEYLDKFLKNLTKDIIQNLQSILGYGIVMFLVLFGLTMIFPILQSFIWLGKGYFIIAVIFVLGLTTLVVKQIYEWKCKTKGG